MSFRFTFAAPAFCLRSNSTTHSYKVQFVSLKLSIPRIKVNPSISLTIEKKLQSTPALYPITVPSVRFFSIPAEQKFFQTDSLFPGNSIPRVVLIGLHTTQAVHGSYGTSAFNFAHRDVTDIAITIGGHSFPSPNGYSRLQYQGNDQNYAQAYLGLNDNCLKINEGCLINYSEFPVSFALYKFHFNVTSETLDHRHIERVAPARLTISFSPESTNPPLTVVVYSEQDRMLAITGSRECLKDYVN